MLYAILLILFPMIFSVLVNLIIDEDKKDELFCDLKYILGVLFRIIKIIAIVCFAFVVLFATEIKQNQISILLLNIFYYCAFCSLIIVVNYFGTRYLKFKICIKIFLDELVNFISSNFILNLLFLTLLVFIKKYNDLTIGLIGSYFFFVLTTIHAGYKQNIGDQNKNFKFWDIVAQTLLNLFMLTSFVSVERIISHYSQSQTMVIKFSDAWHVLALSAVIAINVFLPKIECFCKQFNKFKKR